MQILIPVLKEVDVLIIGAILSGCDLAVRLRKAGRRVMITTSDTTLGDDIVGRLDPITPAPTLNRENWDSIAHIQASLDKQLLDAGAEFIFGAIPIRPLLATGTRQLSGWIFFSKSGYFAIAAKAVVDATCDGFLPFQMRLNRRSSGIAECTAHWNFIGECQPTDNIPGASVEVSLKPVDANGSMAPFCQYKRTFRLRQNDVSGILHAEMLLRQDAATPKALVTASHAYFEFSHDAWQGVSPSTTLPLYRSETLDVTTLLQETIPAVSLANTFLDVESRQESPDLQIVWKAPHARPVTKETRISFALEALSAEAPSMDVVVISAGADGVSAARTAAQKGLRVLLITSTDFPTDALQEMRKDGVEVWFHTFVGGVLMNRHDVAGVLVITSDGTSCLIHAPIVIDATDCAAIAAAAGASMHYPYEMEPITHGAVVAPRMPSNPFGNPEKIRFSHNDLQDMTYAHTMLHLREETQSPAKRPLGKHDRPRIMAEITLLPHDLVLKRRYADTIAVSPGTFPRFQDSCHPLLWLDNLCGQPTEIWIPLRTILPLRIDGMIVLGKALSAHKDVIRAIEDDNLFTREGVAAALLAFHALQEGTTLRKMSVRPVQEELVSRGLLPPEVLQQGDTFLDQEGTSLAAVFNRPDQARRMLQARFETDHDLRTATILAFLGDSSGRDVLSQALRQLAKGTDAREFCTLASAYTTIGGTAAGMLDKLQTLTPQSSLPLLRVICIFFQRWPTREAIQKLRTLRDQLMPHLPMYEKGLPDDIQGALKGMSTSQLKFLYLSAALHACDPNDESANISLENAKRSWLLLVALLAHATRS